MEGVNKNNECINSIIFLSCFEKIIPTVFENSSYLTITSAIFILIVFEISGFVHDFQGQRKVKSEFGFDWAAAISRSVTKRMFEFLNPRLP